jgi:transposase-like protein
VCRRYGVNDSTLRSWVRRGNVRTYDDGQVDLIDVLARLTDTPHTEQCLTTSQRRCNAGG